jgi:hypothetical protein
VFRTIYATVLHFFRDKIDELKGLYEAGSHQYPKRHVKRDVEVEEKEFEEQEGGVDHEDVEDDEEQEEEGSRRGEKRSGEEVDGKEENEEEEDEEDEEGQKEEEQEEEFVDAMEETRESPPSLARKEISLDSLASSKRAFVDRHDADTNLSSGPKKLRNGMMVSSFFHFPLIIFSFIISLVLLTNVLVVYTCVEKEKGYCSV